MGGKTMAENVGALSLQGSDSTEVSPDYLIDLPGSKFFSPLMNKHFRHRTPLGRTPGEVFPE